MPAPAAAGPPEGEDRAVAEIRSEHSGDYLRLARLWERRSHHSWVFAVVNADRYRDLLIARLDAAKPSAHLLLSEGQTPLDWLNALSLLRDADETRAQVKFAEGWFPNAQWWYEANVLRERLADAFPHLLVLWLPESVVSEIARQAPDFWNWREAVFDFSLRERIQPPALQSAAFTGISGADKQQVVSRLADIQTYLANNDASSAAAAHLMLEAASANERLGQWTEAEKFAEKAFSAFNGQNNLRQAAHAKGKIADILQARGKLDEALVIWEVEVLPVFVTVGYAVEERIARERIATLQTMLARSKKS